MKDTCCIVLAAGEGKRMKSHKPKVLSEVLFKPMLGWIIDTLFECKIDNICVVTGFKHEMVEDYLDSNNYKCETVVQNERKGTAHAVMMAGDFLKSNIAKDVLILAGDAPFVDKTIIEKAYKEHKSKGNKATIISSDLDNPFGYGRILRDGSNVVGIVEEKDASELQKKIKEVNSGAYWFSIDFLLRVLYNISNDTSQGEYYLTDAIELLLQNKNKVGVVKSESCDVVLGANNSEQLGVINDIARKRIIKNFVSNGISIPCIDGIIIGKDVEIHTGCNILPGSIILGKTVLGENCVVGPNSYIVDCCVGGNTNIISSYCVNSNIAKDMSVGPFESIVNNRDKYELSL